MSLVLDIKKRYPGFILDMQLEAGEERVALLGASGLSLIHISPHPTGRLGWR